jgi:hypothetical protein
MSTWTRPTRLFLSRCWTLDETRDDVGVDNEDTCEVFSDPVDDGTYWLTSDQMKEMMLPERPMFYIPKPGHFKEAPERIPLSVDKARRDMWEQCKKEVETFRTNLKNVPELPSSSVC